MPWRCAAGDDIRGDAPLTRLGARGLQCLRAKLRPSPSGTSRVDDAFIVVLCASSCSAALPHCLAVAVRAGQRRAVDHCGHALRRALPRSSGAEKRAIGFDARNLARISDVSSPMQSHVALLVLAAIAACACFNHDGSSPSICINGGRRRYLGGIAPAPLGALLEAKAVHCAPDGAK